MITFYPPERVEKVLGVPWLIPLQLPRPFPDYICRVNHRRGVIYWHCWHFRGMPPPPALRHHLPVHPSLRLIPSINASRQAPGYRSPFPVPRPPRPSSPALLRPSVPLHHSQLKEAAWVALICSYEYASASYPSTKAGRWNSCRGSTHCIEMTRGSDGGVVWTGNILIWLQ